jgi:LuxR family maltose regulon positive regulatory protein
MAHSCQARLSLLRGDVKTAKQWLDTFDEAPDVVAMSFFLEIPSITQCRVLIGMGLDTHLKEAAMRLERLWEATQAIHNTFQMIEIGVLRAQALQRMSHLEEALAVLDHVVNLSAPGGWIRPYVELDSPMAELLKRLRTQHTAVDYIDEILAAFESTKDDMWLTVANSPTTPAPSSSAPPLDEPLTTRELDILELLAQRYQDKEIAAQLCIAPTTVKTHLKHLYQKLQVSTRRQAVAKGHALGLLTHR